MIQVCIFLHSTTDFDSREIALNPDPLNLPPLDPKDALLLADPSTSTAAFPMNGNGHSASNPVQPTLASVSWLRKTEYITRESSQRQIGQEPYVFVAHVSCASARIFAGNTSSLRLSTCQEAHNCVTSMPLLLLRMTTSHLTSCNILISQMSLQWNHIPYFQTLTFGQINTTYSDSRKDLENDPLM